MGGCSRYHGALVEAGIEMAKEKTEETGRSGEAAARCNTAASLLSPYFVKGKSTRLNRTDSEDGG